MDPIKILLDASLFQIVGLMIFLVFLKVSHILDDVFWNYEKVQCIFNDASVGRNFFQEMPACAIDDAFTPV